MSRRDLKPVETAVRRELRNIYANKDVVDLFHRYNPRAKLLGERIPLLTTAEVELRNMVQFTGVFQLDRDQLRFVPRKVNTKQFSVKDIWYREWHNKLSHIGLGQLFLDNLLISRVWMQARSDMEWRLVDGVRHYSVDIRRDPRFDKAVVYRLRDNRRRTGFIGINCPVTLTELLDSGMLDSDELRGRSSSVVSERSSTGLDYELEL